MISIIIVVYNQGMVWNGMEWKMEWNGNFGMEYGRCQNGMEDNLPYQFHTRFRALYLQKNTHRCRVVIKYCRRSIQLQYLRILLVDKSRYFGCVHCANSVHCTYCIIVSTLQFNCSIDVTVDDLDRLDLFFFF